MTALDSVQVEPVIGEKLPRTCGICGSEARERLFSGQIRDGRFGQLSQEVETIWRCSGCGVGFLDADANIDYASSEYRELVDGSAEVRRYYELHDAEQAAKLNIVGTNRLRDKVIMDVGCGAGSFLDLVKGYAVETIAIEPTRDYHPALSSQGHRVFSLCSDAAAELERKVDIAVCFSVIEHVADPTQFLREIHRLLKPGGQLILSTPNVDDWLIELSPDRYAPFFFRTVHRWYFSGKSLEYLAAAAAFRDTTVRYVHRFGLANLLAWLRDGRPTGHNAFQVWSTLDAAFRSALESSGRADYIYAELTA
jgi:2-polyprenyl-3-methyl-5-hydroxy-6-metoxy-1,4-benzoquinol methylase